MTKNDSISFHPCLRIDKSLKIHIAGILPWQLYHWGVLLVDGSQVRYDHCIGSSRSGIPLSIPFISSVGYLAWCRALSSFCVLQIVAAFYIKYFYFLYFLLELTNIFLVLQHTHLCELVHKGFLPKLVVVVYFRVVVLAVFTDLQEVITSEALRIGLELLDFTDNVRLQFCHWVIQLCVYLV